MTNLDKMKENPFQMADDIWGIGFKTADGSAFCADHDVDRDG